MSLRKVWHKILLFLVSSFHFALHFLNTTDASLVFEFKRADVHLVWVRCNEGLDYVYNISVPIHIVNKCDEVEKWEEAVPAKIVSVLHTENLGDESVGYLYWIMQNYSELPEHVVFSHGIHPRTFVPLPYLFDFCLRHKLPKGYVNFNIGGKKKFTTKHIKRDLDVGRAARMHHKAVQRLNIKKFKNLENEVVSTSWGNTWLVSKEIILQWPREFYDSSYSAAIDSSVKQECDSCRMLYNKNGEYNSLKKYPRHNEVGIYYEYIFDIIWNGGRKRNLPPSVREINKFIRRICNPESPESLRSAYWKKERKFNSFSWASYLSKEYGQ